MFMRTQVIFASLLMLTVSLAGCITDSAVEQTTDEITEVLGCMDESALNYNVNATNSSGLCLSEAQLLLAEDVFWSSWDADAINNATGPVGYRLMIGETSADDNESACLEIQEVFSPDYYDQEIVGAFESDNISAGTCEERAEQIFRVQNDTAEGRGGTVKFFNDAKGFGFKNSQTVFDNVVQVEKFSDGEWDNYSMDTASTYDEFRNRLEHGPGIRSSDDCCAETADGLDGGREDGGQGNNDCNDRKDCVNPGFPSVVDSEYTHTVIDEVELREGRHAQTIYYFAKDASTGTEIEVMGEMTEDGFKITEYCNEIPSTNYSIIDSYMGIRADDTLAGLSQRSFVISARIILLETDGNELRFEEYDYVEPVNSRSENGTNTEVLGGVRAIPFYFDWIPDSDANETENKSATEEGRKGLNAVNVKVVIAGPSGPYGMEGDLSDYHLVTSNCTFDNATTGEDYTTEADNMTRDDEEETSGRSENATRDAVSALPTGKRVYGSDGNTCTNIDVYDLSDIDGLLEHGIVFVDADSSGTLSEGDRFEFSDNFTCDDCAEANMLRLFSISADEFSDGNINPSSKMSVVHEGAMNAIRNIRAVTPDDPAPPVSDCACHNSTRSNRHT
jgi:cold shock CspA family protein